MVHSDLYTTNLEETSRAERTEYGLIEDEANVNFDVIGGRGPGDLHLGLDVYRKDLRVLLRSVMIPNMNTTKSVRVTIIYFTEKKGLERQRYSYK